MIKHSSLGFTLIELLVVISIIGVLASVGLASLTDARLSAQYTAARLEMKVILDAITVAGRPGQTLAQITNSFCTMCVCRDRFGGGSDLREVTDSEVCYTSLDTSMQNIAAVSPLLDASGGPRRDPWGSPYLIDENEREFLDQPNNINRICRPDFIRTVGPDGIFGTPDDYIVLVPFRSSSCLGNTVDFYLH